MARVPSSTLFPLPLCELFGSKQGARQRVMLWDAPLLSATARKCKATSFDSTSRKP